MPTITVDIGKDQIRRWDIVAGALGVSRAELVRRGVDALCATAGNSLPGGVTLDDIAAAIAETATAQTEVEGAQQGGYGI